MKTRDSICILLFPCLCAVSLPSQAEDTPAKETAVKEAFEKYEKANQRPAEPSR